MFHADFETENDFCTEGIHLSWYTAQLTCLPAHSENLLGGVREKPGEREKGRERETERERERERGSRDKRRE